MPIRIFTTAKAALIANQQLYLMIRFVQLRAFITSELGTVDTDLLLYLPERELRHELAEPIKCSIIGHLKIKDILVNFTFDELGRDENNEVLVKIIPNQKPDKLQSSIEKLHLSLLQSMQ